MRVLRDMSAYEAGAGLHVAIGIFDGVHRGHRAVIESAIQSARNGGGQSAVLTFTPHPTRLFRPQEPTLLLQPLEQKEAVLERMGVGLLLLHPFTKEFAALSAEGFLSELKRLLPTLRSVHVGENFRFGKGRQGDVDFLAAHAKKLGIHVISVQRLRMDGEAISSTRIRSCLQEGHIAEANNLLGYNYFSVGAVQPGRQLGRQLGFPTLNLAWEPECRPRLGVYTVQVRQQGSDRKYPGVANYGVRPTVEETTTALLEVHVLSQDCPFDSGDCLIVEWMDFLRPEQRFASLDELKAQIALDRDRAREFFRSRDGG